MSESEEADFREYRVPVQPPFGGTRRVEVQADSPEMAASLALGESPAGTEIKTRFLEEHFK